jgi:ABC-type sugar transport system ATPase subunit
MGRKFLFLALQESREFGIETVYQTLSLIERFNNLAEFIF